MIKDLRSSWTRQESIIKLNLSKAKFAVKEARYCGHIVSAEGLKPDPEKIGAIVNYERPKDRAAVQQFLGMLAYLSKFFVKGSDLTAPLRKLLELETDFKWTDQQEQAFINIKKALTSPPVLAYFDPNKQTKISVDASSHGLGAVIIQEDKPIAYASRALTVTQKKYAQIEKELLAVLFGCQKFEKYIFGASVVVETDHKPLEYIFRRPLSVAPARLQRMLMSLQRFRLEVKYVPGPKLAAADALSRAHLQYSEELEEELQITMITATTPAKWKEFVKETARDPTLAALKEAVMKGWPNSKKNVPELIKPYWELRHGLTITDEVLFQMDRIVVPKVMRPDMLRLIHEGHLGTELCKRRAREALYWPGMNAEIDQMVERCAPCQQQRRLNQRETLIQHPVPDVPFLRVAADFFEIDGQQHILFVDYTSGYIDVHKTKSTSLGEAINCAKQTFRRLGIPERLISDNMPFSSREFKDFACEWGIEITTSSPEYPQSNGLAERSIQTVKKLFKACIAMGQDCNLALLNLNNAPREHRPSPAQSLMGRRQRTKLPMVIAALLPFSPGNMAQMKRTRQSREKEKYDQRAKDLQTLNPGQLVRMRIKNNKWRDAVVIKRLEEPRSYLIKAGDTHYRRNRRHLAIRHMPEEEEEPKEAQEAKVPGDTEAVQQRGDITAEKAPLRQCSRAHVRPSYLSDYVEY